MAGQQAALRKRQQIAKASRTMFLAVAGASVVAGISIVVGISLFKKISFNQEVIAQQSKTAKTLEGNIESVKELKSNIVVLSSENESLNRLRAEPTDERLQVVLDALPAGPNSVALGSSLETKLLPDASGFITIESLSVDGTDEASEATGEAQPIPFAFSVTSRRSGDAAIQDFKDLLTRLERSIRAINVRSITISLNASKAQMSVEAEAYYAQGVSAELETKTLSPKGAKGVKTDEKE